MNASWSKRTTGGRPPKYNKHGQLSRLCHAQVQSDRLIAGSRDRDRSWPVGHALWQRIVVLGLHEGVEHVPSALSESRESHRAGRAVVSVVVVRAKSERSLRTPVGPTCNFPALTRTEFDVRRHHFGRQRTSLHTREINIPVIELLDEPRRFWLRHRCGVRGRLGIVSGHHQGRPSNRYEQRAAPSTAHQVFAGLSVRRP